MTKIDLHQVDAFTTTLFGGNPAGVVTNADALSETDMQNIAREMNLSETAFVCLASDNNATLKLRFFTRSGDEVPFCGHATVGALAQLAELNLFELGQPGIRAVRVETGIGILEMKVADDDTTKIIFTAPAVTLEQYSLQGKEFADKLGVPVELIHPKAVISRDTTLNYLYIPVASLKTLGEQAFDSNRIREKFGQENIVVFCLYTPETFSETASLHARSLAPNIGIDEDPFTGSMQAGLVQAAKENNLIDPTLTTITTEQGHFVERPGLATVHQTIDNRITVAASAVPVFSTTMEI
jgi:PhzF family phenazine biosynthesis protein